MCLLQRKRKNTRPKVQRRPCTVRRGLCLTSFATMKLPPPPFPPPLTFFHPAHCSSLIQQIGRKRRDRDSGRDGGSPSPQLSSSSCLYACLIGQKQHACLYSQGNGWTLDWAGGPGFSPSSFKKRRLCPRLLLLGCLGDVCCHCFANYCSPCIAGEPVEGAMVDWPVCLVVIVL